MNPDLILHPTGFSRSPAGASSDLHLALDELEKAAAGQTGAICDLEGRLGPVLIDPLPFDGGVATTCEPSSPVVNRIRTIARHVAANDHHLRELLHRLTV